MNRYAASDFHDLAYSAKEGSSDDFLADRDICLPSGIVKQTVRQRRLLLPRSTQAGWYLLAAVFQWQSDHPRRAAGKTAAGVSKRITMGKEFV